MIEGIDISSYQPTIDWPTLAKTVGFVFIKATEGTTRLDKCFAQHWKDANGVSIPAGAYHFMTPGNPEAQADFFVATLQAQVQSYKHAFEAAP